MTMYTNDAPGSFKPEHVTGLLIKPLQDESVAMQVANVLTLAGDQGGPHTLRVPIVASDATAAWTAEGAEIATSDAALDEVTADFHKLAGLSIISNELAADTDPAAIGMVGQGLARDLARKVDAAFFGDLDAPAPEGLGSLTTGTVDAGTEWANLDPFLAAAANAEKLGATLTAFVAHPDDALALAQIRESTGSNRNLLQPDPASVTGRVINGRPLHTSPAVEQGTIWGVPQDRVVVGLRKDAEVTVDGSAYFSSDRTAIRAITRVAFAFPHAEAVQRISLTA